jgi:predicted nuclease of predicted toxin-antitoxin system
VKCKLDENLGCSALEVLTLAGHDVDTVLQEGLSGTDDDHLFLVCQTEQRALITLDRDFGQTLRFPPGQSAGIAILELPPRLHPQSIVARLKELLVLIAMRPISGELWIVEPGRIRIHNPAQRA